ncbi:MAG: hypothetical protein L6R48_26285, partial [Planctomycetes bacterium]|nr:hypothetical protein [Planctomycetota bacterium]
NPISHGIAIAYDWALTRMLRHKVAFSVTIASFALFGWMLGTGWSTVSWPLRQGFAAVGADITQTRFDAAMRSAFPGIGASFLPPLDEGSLLFMPSVPATAG